ncbi:MAG: glycosyltransferase [Ornithinimicrobium sp.]
MSDLAGRPAALRVFGRPPRVALLVYNDAHNDSRVLKTAASLRNAGALVRIFAVARRRAGYADGSGLVGEAIAVERAPELELARYAPGRLALGIARRLSGRETPTDAGRTTVGGHTAGDGDAGHSAAGGATGGDVDGRAAEVGQVAAGLTATGAPPALETLQALEASGPAVPMSEPGASETVCRGPSLRTAETAFLDLWLRTYRTLSLGLYWLHTARAAARWQPDVIHANDGNTLAPAVWIAHTSGARIIYDSHELWLHRNVRGDRPVAPWVEAIIERSAIGRAAGVITVSPSIATWLEQRYRLPHPPTVVRNAPRAQCTPDGEALQTSVNQGLLRDLAGLRRDEQVIAYAGRITSSRGIEETLQALTLLPPMVHFVLLGYGEPDYLARLHTFIGEHRIGPRVHFVGAVGSNDVSAALADADVSVVFVRPICTSYEFSLPNKLFESIHAGVPVVAAELPDTAALVREHNVGEIFATAESVDMARTIEAVLADPRPYRLAARQAASILTWQHEEVGLLKLYADVLAR